VGGLPGNSITGNVAFTAGNGYGNPLDVRTGGAGGSIADAVIVTAGDIVLKAGDGGEADDDIPDNTNISNTVGGLGGSIDPLELSGAHITVTAGTGGHGVNGGRGGTIDDLAINVGVELNLFGGDGGTATDKNGGDGGDVRKIVVDGTGFVRTIAAGDGGIHSDLLHGKDGNGGSVKNVTFIGGTIGDFSGAFGIGGMGGLFAGDGDTTGDVTDVIAASISAIVANNTDPFTPTLVNAARSVTGIVAGGPGIAIGADLDADGAFDFDDSASPDGNFDPATDGPIDGLVLAESLGTVTGTTLFAFETNTGLSTGIVDPN
jgi:hypothetical protein